MQDTNFEPLPHLQHFFDERDELKKHGQYYSKLARKYSRGFVGFIIGAIFFTLLYRNIGVIISVVCVLIALYYSYKRKWAEKELQKVKDALQALGVQYKEEYRASKQPINSDRSGIMGGETFPNDTTRRIASPDDEFNDGFDDDGFGDDGGFDDGGWGDDGDFGGGGDGGDFGGDGGGFDGGGDSDGGGDGD